MAYCPNCPTFLLHWLLPNRPVPPDNPRDRDGITLPVFPFWLLDITQPTDWNDSCPLVVRYVLQWRRAANIIFDPLPNEDGGLRLGYRD